jgi:hypothetical protein
MAGGNTMSGIIVTTPEELAALVEKAVTDAVSKLPQSGAKEVLNLEECAKLLDRHERVVMSRLVAEDKLPCHYISEREPRFLRSEVLAWLLTRPSKREAA